MKLLIVISVALIIGCTNADGGNQKFILSDKDSAIYEAVLRYAFLNNASSLQSSADFYAIELDGHDAPADFIARFDNVKNPIYPISMTKMNCKKGVYLKNYNQKGIQFFIDRPEYEMDTKIKIFWHYSEGCTNSAFSIMRLEFKNGVWVVLSDEMIVIS